MSESKVINLPKKLPLAERISEAKQIISEWKAKFWLLENIKKRFDREGVEIPFPYRTVVYKNDLPPPRQKGVNSEQPA
jgi:small-conductance mechanosensitive channel